MTRQSRDESGPSDEATVARGRGRRRRALTITGTAAGLALGVMAGWGVLGDGTGAADDERSPGDRRAAVTDDELLRRASERLIAGCMARHGFAYSEQPPPSAERKFRYVLDDAGWAREHGYGPLLGRPGAWEKDVNFGNLEKLTPERQRAWQRTLLGSGRGLAVDLPDLGRISAPDNGCTAAARRVLYRDLAGWYRVRRIADHLGGYTAGEVTGSSEYRAGLAAWASCARGRGYAASTPRELRGLVAPKAPGTAGERAGKREIDAAVTEAECAVSTGFSQAVGALERRYRPEVERRFARELDALKSFEREALPRARKTLADS
ncbi:MAG: hypothetical protein ACRDNL_04110 [Spirillospora sp.]